LLPPSDAELVDPASVPLAFEPASLLPDPQAARVNTIVPASSTESNFFFIILISSFLKNYYV
jgi:hypothetical protein